MGSTNLVDLNFAHIQDIQKSKCSHTVGHCGQICLVSGRRNKPVIGMTQMFKYKYEIKIKTMEGMYQTLTTPRRFQSLCERRKGYCNVAAVYTPHPRLIGGLF